MTTLAEALATARRARGLSQEELAAQAGVSQEAISRYESERRFPDGDVLAKLADVLQVTPQFLQHVQDIKGAWAVDAHMRRRATASPRVWRQLEARLNMLRNHARFLYEEIDMRTQQVVPTFDPLFMEPADAARLTRMQWRVPIGPIRSVTAWLESAGCLVIEENFGTARVDGLSQWVDDHPVLLINAEAPTDRKRLTLADELGHLCLHTQDIGEDAEREASLFAAEFLMPAEVIRPQLGGLTLGRLVDLKRYWGVSIQALIERASNLGMLPASKRTAFYKQLSAKGWRRTEPASEELAPEKAEFAHHIGDALLRRGLSHAEVCAMTGFSQDATDNPFVGTVRLRAV